MNIDSARVGGYSRSRCSGSNESVISNISGPVSRLKTSTASTSRTSRLMYLACCRERDSALRSLKAGLAVVGGAVW
jgi:hypothetical protein